ncbi:transforming growth factor beta regulator 1-like [Acyrthosiphon pisum]|uniref:ACYPI002962 protein n=1 Tax=Acyrthosiphon pisum TaxID=7029 RepID=C4WWG5_ACYPI|nr:transforming growth factor beta regulator 1-like [Acyrthosiphon pisum]BAH72235.1 ACYPI002962 [Acyrthosiphon pisum]|eukprot:NP_001156128.1 transforming growth factor beta regulator 1-like [Acyrthosiphon pisum]
MYPVDNRNVWINNIINPSSRYGIKCKKLKKVIKDMVFENAALCDEISQNQEKLLIVREECKFLTKKLNIFEPQLDAPINIAPVKKATPRKKATTNGVTPKPRRPAAKRKKVNNIIEVQEPITSGNVTIYNFGEIVYDTPFYYSDCAIYPAGFYATRTYAHFRNIFSKCTYHCKVIKAGSSPRFEIMDHDKHFKVTGLSTDECHSHLISLINKLLGAEDLIPANRNGDRFFGLTLPPVRMKLQEAPESKFCTGYIPLELQSDYHEAEVKAESDPAVSFEGLHNTLNRFRSRH